MKTIVIEDFDSIRETFALRFSEQINKDEIHLFDLKSLVSDNLNHTLNDDSLSNSLINLINEFSDIDEIRIATTFRTIILGETIDIFDLLLEKVLREPKIVKKIGRVLVYSYEYEDDSKFYSKLSKMSEKYPDVYFDDFETSVIFRKEAGIKLYENNSDGYFINKSLVKYYVEFLAYGILHFSGHKSSIGLNIISKRTRDLNQFIYTFNRKLIKNSSFRLGFLSFLNPKELSSSYGLDSPYKPYYNEINDEIIKKGYDEIYKCNEEDFHSGKHGLYFRIYRFDNTLKVYWDYLDASRNLEKLPYYVCNKTNNSNDLFDFWVKILFYSIYYRASPIEKDNNVDYISYLNNTIQVEILTEENLLDFKTNRHIEFIWLFSELKIPSFDYKGLLNYSFFREFEENAVTGFEKNKIKSYVENIYYVYRQFIESKVYDTLYPYFSQNLRQHSLLNALSTVLNRNGSHNLGSHVLATLSSEDLIRNFLNNKRGNTKYSPQYYYTLNQKKLTKEELENEKSFKKLEFQNTESLLAYFNAYLKNRLDLLAAVGTSGEAVMLNNKPLFASVFKNFERNLILLEHISGKGLDFKYKFCLTKDNSSCNIDTDFSKNNDVEVAMPNDLLGEQAFYLLLENVIRNTAKHGIYNSSGQVEFTININTTESDDNFYAIELWDNNCLQERVNKENESIEKEGSEKSKVTIVADTNKRIDKNILQEDFNIREGSWGTIEMKIACCYLSGLPLKEIDNDAYRTDAINNRLPIIQAFEKVIDSNTSHLGYRFYIQKPKSVLVVDLDNQFNNTEDDKSVSVLKGKGIDILSKEAFDKAIEKKEIFKHQFKVVLTKKAIDEIQETLNKWDWDLNKQLPNRSLFISEKEFIDEDFLNTCYQIELDKVNPLFSNIDKDKKKEKYVISIDYDYDFYALPKGVFKIFKDNVLEYNYEGEFTHHEVTNTNDKKIYAEPYGSISSLGLYLNDRKNPNKINKVYFELLEAVKYKVLVIDERVQNALKTNFIPDKNKEISVSVEFKKIYEDTNIIVPSKIIENIELNLNKPQDYIDNIKQFIEKQIRENKIDFFIFHFGILEKIIPNGNKKKFKTYLNQCRSYSTHPLKIILTSGRGIPSDLPKDEYFCNFSSINYYLTDANGRSKVHLTQLLQNQRAK